MIKGVKTISEYAIRRWLQDQNFLMGEFQLVMSENEAKLIDSNKDTLTLVYDSDSKIVYIKE